VNEPDPMDWEPSDAPKVARWLLSPDREGDPVLRDHVMMICPTCGRKGSVHESIAEHAKVVCCGGRPADHVPENKWAIDFMPPHEPAECRPAT